MFQAGTNVFIGLFSIGTIVALLMPLDAKPASALSSNTQQVIGQSVAVAKTDVPVAKPDLSSNEKGTASASSLLSINVFNALKQTSFSENSAFLTALQQPKAKPVTDKSVLAAARAVQPIEGAQTSPTASTAAATDPAIIEAAVVNAEIEAAKDTSSYALNPDKLFDMVNQYRVSIGLPAVQRRDEVNQVAVSRAPEIFDEIFVNWNMHAGFYARNLPYQASEIIIYYNTEDGALNWWLNSSVHRGIIQGDWKYAGIGCEGKACAMIFANLEIPSYSAMYTVSPTPVK
jgi:uncharacterized protein YkwD